MIKKALCFFKTGIWETDMGRQPQWKAILVKQCRIFILSSIAFKKDHCILRSSALTFFSVLSVVPVVAMFFAIAKGFGLEQMLEERLSTALAGYEELAQRIMLFARNMLNDTKSGVIAGVGVVVLLWSVMKVLGNIEEAFNAIWKVARGRTFVRKFTDYFAIMLTAPILLILSSSMTVFVSSMVQAVTQRIVLLGLFAPFIFFLLKFLPYLLFWVLFMLMYMIMPNTKVKTKSALITGVIFGTVFQVVEWGYINFQVGVSSYNAIYGSFAALPLFLFWLQISWSIVLFGAEYSYAFQNFDRYGSPAADTDIAFRDRQVMAIGIASHVVKNFLHNHPPMTMEAISTEMKISRIHVERIVNELVECGIFTRCVLSDSKNRNIQAIGYQPARNPETLTVAEIISLLSGSSEPGVIHSVSDAGGNVEKVLAQIAHSIRNSEGNMRIRDL